MRRGQATDAREQGALAGNEPQIQKVVERLEINVPGDRRVLQDGLDLGAEAQRTTIEVVVQRLHPEVIPR